ncbi:MAG: rod shape-determining protein MreC [Anaerolineales bacterium]|jgi:rod shape-determining protein MreC|nr:rod shape-determining protein MreC [Anaerolineales bacterium]MBX3004743.1 rod shape-determining protein MreC [Anaerolineales bacterium]
MRPSRNNPYQLAALLVLAAGILLLALGGYLTPVFNGAMNPIYGVQSWLYTRFQAIQDFVNAPVNIASLRQENAQLRAENAQLQTEIITLQQQVLENELLSALLDFARARPENVYQAAGVIGQDPSPFLHYIIINRGSDDGIRRGMPVVSQQGLVGRISQVTATAARVELITDPGSQVSVRIQPSEVDGLLSGSVTSQIGIDLLPLDASLQPGDLVFTSGIGGGYPSNILIGQVSNVRREATALFQTASVQPAVDFTQLEIVLIIVNFQPLDLSPLTGTSN